ncbi:hypothetical protein EMCRGX_G020218 [Ephydatia muelleri]|eukprot:Em0016g154a
MSLKDEVAAWQKGVDRAAEAKYDEAIACFSEMAEPGARIFFNIASMYLKLGDLKNAKKNLDKCLEKDPHHALAYFQRGCLSLQTESYEDALSDFELAEKNLRGNVLIDYKQLGLQYKLYSCEIMYNKAYVYAQTGRRSDAQEEMEKASAMSEKSSENRHKIISAALDDMRAGKRFLPYRLPKSCTVFCPPRNKTESLKPVDFLGKAKVLSSVVDKDDYTGFVGAQELKQSSEQPSQRPAESRSKSPSPMPDSGTKLPKPSGPPPQKLDVQTPVRKVSSEDGPAPEGTSRPPKPTQAPPLLTKTGLTSPPMSPLPARPGQPAANREEAMVTVKIHYTTTRAIRISKSAGFEELVQAVCEKCERPKNTLTLWFKKGPGELSEITSNASLKAACARLEDGYRLTLWAYDKEQEPAEQAGRHVVAIGDYKGQFSDELSFKTGDKLEVTLDVSDDWYEGKFQGKTGIFPKTYVKDTA